MPANSDFAGQPVVQTGTVTINERQGITVVSRSFVYEGATETFFYSDSTGNSQHNATIHTGKDLKTKTKWDDGVLKVTTTQSGAVTLERLQPCRGRHYARQRRKTGPQADHPGLPAPISTGVTL